MREINWQTYGQTVLNPVGLLVLTICVLLLLVLDRKYLLIPFFIITCYITTMQRIVVGGLDFSFIRIMVVFFVLRLILKSKEYPIKLNTIDKVLIVYIIFKIIFYTLMLRTASAFINRLGTSMEILGTYFIVRYVVRSMDDLVYNMKVLAMILVFVAFAMIVEQITMYNFFSVFGGVPSITIIREGRLRSQGPLSHPIMAGSLGASFFPIFFGVFWYNKKNNKMVLMGLISCLAITLTSSSSGPILGLAASIFGLVIWRFRRYIKVYLQSFVLGLIALDLVMAAPVYHLIGRIDIVGGSTGEHRYRLIDGFFTNFREWFLFGVPSTAHWGWGLQDITNQFVLEGVRGGILTLSMFIAIFVVCYGKIGKINRKLVGQTTFNRKHFIVWVLGVALFSHIVNFIGVSYFGQMENFFYITVALVASVKIDEVVDLKNTSS